MNADAATTDVVSIDMEDIHAAIRAAGGRLTVPTRVLISILASSDGHLTADDLIDAVEERIPGVSPSTIGSGTSSRSQRVPKQSQRTSRRSL